MEAVEHELCLRQVLADRRDVRGERSRRPRRRSSPENASVCARTVRATFRLCHRRRTRSRRGRGPSRSSGTCAASRGRFRRWQSAATTAASVERISAGDHRPRSSSPCPNGPEDDEPRRPASSSEPAQRRIVRALAHTISSDRQTRPAPAARRSTADTTHAVRFSFTARIRNHTGLPPMGRARNSRTTPPFACTLRPPLCEQHNFARGCAMVIVIPPRSYAVVRDS